MLPWNMVRAVHTHDYQEIKRLLDSKSSLDAENAFGTNLICWAAHEKKTDVLKLLLAFGASPDPRTIYKQPDTALMWSVIHNNIIGVQLLLYHNALTDVLLPSDRTLSSFLYKSTPPTITNAVLHGLTDVEKITISHEMDVYKNTINQVLIKDIVECLTELLPLPTADGHIVLYEWIARLAHGI